MLARPSIALINGYQRYLSPRKGFSCAYRIYYQDSTGCSGYAKRAITENGLLRAIPLIRKRFADCKAAAVAMSNANEEDDQNRPRRSNRQRLFNGFDCLTGCGSICSASSGGGATTPKSGATDGCNALPGSDSNCGCDALPNCTPSCDCGPCSCGS